MKIFLRVGISFALLGLLLYVMRDDLPRICETLKNVNVPIFFAAFLTMIAAILITAKRLQLVFGAQEVTLKISDACNLSFVGSFFNNFLPTSVGGDIVKVMCAARITRHPVKSVTAVLMDRIFGLFTFILIPAISFLIFAKTIRNPYVPIFIYSFLGTALFFCLTIFNKRIARAFGFIRFFLNFLKLEEKARQIYNGLHGFKNHKPVIAQALFLSIFSQLLSIVARFIVVIAIGAQPDPLYFLLLIPIVDLISMAPSLNGLGVREWGYIYLLTPYIGRPHAVALGVLWLAILLGLSIIGGIIYLVRHDYHIHFKEKDIERTIKEII